MTCEQVGPALDAAHDNGDATLPAEVQAHLDGCAACQSYAAFLISLDAEVAALPRVVAPARDLWAGIRARLDGAPVVALDSRRQASAARAPWLAVAAALLVGAGAGIVWMKARPATSTNVASVAPPASTGSVATVTASVPAASDPAPAAASSLPTVGNATAIALPASYQTGAADFDRATADLRSALDARKDTMSKETRAVVEKNLAVIDTALKEIENALQKDPNNRELFRMLGATRKRKIETLQLVVKLTA